MSSLRGRKRCACRQWLLSPGGEPLREQTGVDAAGPRSWVHGLDACGPVAQLPADAEARLERLRREHPAPLMPQPAPGARPPPRSWADPDDDQGAGAR